MNEAVAQKFATYPLAMKSRLLALRELIYTVAQESELGTVQESLKWDEPSYVVKGGSAVRIDWKPQTPQQYAIFFNCNTKLVATFRELYPNAFSYSGNRAILLDVKQPISRKPLKHCLKMALTYHSIKHLSLLGN